MRRGLLGDFYDFVYVSEKGKELMERKCGFLTAMVDRQPWWLAPNSYRRRWELAMNPILVGFANGVLLFRTTDVDEYMVCIPVSGELVYLPMAPGERESFANVSDRQRDHYGSSATAFNCSRSGKAASSSIPLPKVLLQVCLKSDAIAEFSLAEDEAGMVIGATYWTEEEDGRLLAHDQEGGVVVLIQPPPCSEDEFVCHNRCYGESQGKVHYARHDSKHLEVWVLENYNKTSGGSAEWSLKHRVSFELMASNNPNICSGGGTTILKYSAECFDPNNSGLLLLSVYKTPYCFNAATMELKEVGGSTYNPKAKADDDYSQRIKYFPLL
ncbi:OLC1v1023253C2 [Oldenlandia corymbosa var. corymbosa]|nr:OLC1v1023253C2 [Oldenlandia corymbosa var. corymbosa]